VNGPGLPLEPGEWRRLAEQQLGPEDSGDLGDADPRAVVHELRVHQVELEMQNEALVEARQVAEAGWERFQEFFDSAPAGYYSVDAKGRILELNLAGARLLGADRSVLTGRHFPSFLCVADQAVFTAFLWRGLERQDNPPCEVSLPGGQPGGIPVRLQASASADGKVLQMVAMDITDLRAAQDQARLAIRDLQRQVERLTALLEPSGPGSTSQ